MRLSPALLVLVRAAVADMQEASGLGAIAERTRRGEMDQLPVMQAAIAAVERVMAAGSGR